MRAWQAFLDGGKCHGQGPFGGRWSSHAANGHSWIAAPIAEIENSSKIHYTLAVW